MNISALKGIESLPEGYSFGMYKEKKYGITKTIFNAGSSLKIYAEDLGGTDFVSLNMYTIKNKNLIKPCEMPLSKVAHFFANVLLIINANNN